jgi:hypothetical protein
MPSNPNGRHLSKQSRRLRRVVTLLSMLSGHLVCSNLDFLLFSTLLLPSLKTKLMHTCVIMHNMIIEGDRKPRTRHVGPYECEGPLAHVDHQVPAPFADFIVVHAEIRDTNIYTQVQHDLLEHLWRLKGESTIVSDLWSSWTSNCRVYYLFYFHSKQYCKTYVLMYV